MAERAATGTHIRRRDIMATKKSVKDIAPKKTVKGGATSKRQN